MMVEEPWTPAYARLFDPEHELAGDEACRRWAWLDLCNLASFKDHKRVIQGRVVTLRRGEFVASIRFLASRWGWSKDRVRRFLALLESEACGKIATVDTTRDGTVYRVVAYDTYRNPRDSDEYGNGTQAGHQRDTNGTQAGQREEGKEGKDVQKKKPSPVPGSGRVTYPEAFEEVWRIHPRGSKKKALPQWRKAVPALIEQADLIRALSAYRSREVNDRFLGHDLFRWIRDAHWEAQLTIPASKGNTPQSDFLAHMEKAIAARGGVT